MLAVAEKQERLMNRYLNAVRIAMLVALCAMFAGCSLNPAIPKCSPQNHSQTCAAATESEIAALFDQWNNALQSGDPDKVVVLYAEQSVLLPTVSNEPRFTLDEKLDYFRHFLEKQPSAKIDSRHIDIGCDMAADSGIYTFTLAKSGEVIRARYSFVYQWDGLRWRIISHHSSLMPETK